MPDGPVRVGTPVRRAWHALSAGDVVELINSAAHGLSEREAARRLAAMGANEVTPPRREGLLAGLVESLREPLQLLLIVVAVLSATFGELRDAVAITVIIIAVAVTETVTQRRAARAIAALKRLAAPTARVRRNGRVTQIPAAEVVVGDVLVISAGDLIAADARVLAGAGLRVDESSLTGEAQPVAKGPGPVAEAAEVTERSGMLYAGSPVTSGEGLAVVVATGTQTELGTLGRLVAEETEPPTPLRIALARLARVVLVVAIAASVTVPLAGLLAGQDPREMLLAGLTLAFATIPEELPILVTALLAVGGRRLARQGALLRRLRAGETLGAVTTVVTDKTGTLTENRLRLAEIIGDRRRVLAVAVAAQPDHAEAATHDPLDAELARIARSEGIHVVGERVAAYPFDPDRKLTSRAYRVDTATFELAATGAPESVLARCAPTEDERQAAAADVETLSARGLRVVAFARRVLHDPPAERDDVERELTFVGLAAFDDPVRDGAAEAVAQLRAAGVATIVVSGDHPVTVAAIAARAGLPPGGVLTGGAVLAALDDATLSGRLSHATVLARATPADKLRIVRLLQARGEVVAVTGDGVNDGPALAVADVGIAMGRRGSDLARNAADLVLTDDAYPTVVAAVATGRGIAAQLRRAVAFYLGAKVALVTTMLVALAAGLPVVFTPAAIVLLELFMDLGAAVAFVAEPATPAAMHRPPRPARAGFLDAATLSALLLTAVALTIAVLPTYLLLHDNLGRARSAAVLAWLVGHVLIAWCLRAQPGLSWRRNLAFPAWAGAAIGTGMIAALTGAGSAVHLRPLDTGGLLTVAAFVSAALLAAVAGRILLRLPARL